MMMELTRREAQALATIAQRLDRRPFRRKPTSADILDLFLHLGTIQLDTISVISRSHETVIWSRLGAYDPALLPAMYAPGDVLTEYLAHAASIVPTEMLPLFRPYMERAREHDAAWANQPETQPLLRSVIDRVRADGPCSSRDFEAPEGASRAGLWEWWGNKPERRALAMLWVRGDLMIHQRDLAFTRYFDLPERVAPGFWDGEALPVPEQQRALLSHAMRALGVTTAKWATDYFRTGGQAHVPAAQVRKILGEFAAEGRAIPVTVAGIAEPMWMDPSMEEPLARLREGKGRPTLTTLLSPFDNLVWNRDRGEKLWDFFYRLECYVPAPKRQYGYYSLPILHRGQIVGRLDPSYDRKRGVLTIRAIHLEPWVRPSEALGRAIAGAIEDLLGFLGGQPGAWVLEASPDTAGTDLLRPHAGEVMRTQEASRATPPRQASRP